MKMTRWLGFALLAALPGGCAGDDVWHLQVSQAMFLEDDEQPNVCLVVADSSGSETSSECTAYVPGEPTLRTQFEPANVDARVQLRTQAGAVLVIPLGEDPTEGVLEASEDGRSVAVELSLEELSNDYVY